MLYQRFLLSNKKYKCIQCQEQHYFGSPFLPIEDEMGPRFFFLSKLSHLITKIVLFIALYTFVLLTTTHSSILAWRIPWTV